MSTSLVQSAGVTGHLHLQTCISEPCHCDTRWCVTPCCLVVVAITTVLAFGENLTLQLHERDSILAHQHSLNRAWTPLHNVYSQKCYSLSKAVCLILCLCQSVKIAAELIEQQGCRKSKTLKKGLIDWLKLFCLLPMSCCSDCQLPRQSPLAELPQ